MLPVIGILKNSRNFYENRLFKTIITNVCKRWSIFAVFVDKPHPWIDIINFTSNHDMQSFFHLTQKNVYNITSQEPLTINENWLQWTVYHQSITLSIIYNASYIE